MKILLSAGETSGDRIGARLAAAIGRLDPAAELAGCAGPSMVAAGVRPLADSSDFSHAGWESVLAKAPQLLWQAWRYFQKARKFAPELVILIDSPGLHSPMSNEFRRLGVRCVWVAPPQLWAWKDRNLSALRGMRVHPLHEFEVDSLRRGGADPLWLGYPGPRPARGDGHRDLLALLPGSRRAWRRRHAEIFLNAARAADTGLQPVFVQSRPPDSRELGFPCLCPEEAFPRAALALTLPGTATLECALQEIPAVVAAIPGRIDQWIATRRLSNGPYALPNRILGKMVYPELIGRRFHRDEIALALGRAWNRAGHQRELDAFRQRLGPEDAAERIASSLLEAD